MKASVDKTSQHDFINLPPIGRCPCPALSSNRLRWVPSSHPAHHPDFVLMGILSRYSILICEDRWKARTSRLSTGALSATRGRWPRDAGAKWRGGGDCGAASSISVRLLRDGGKCEVQARFTNLLSCAKFVTQWTAASDVMLAELAEETWARSCTGPGGCSTVTPACCAPH